MISEFVQRFDAARPSLLARFKEKHPENYEEIVRAVVEVCAVAEDCEDYEVPDPDRITVIDNDGCTRGILVFVIAAKGYEPQHFWVTVVSYGSCSHCDTLQRIRVYSEDTPTDEQAKQYLTLALHIVQRMRCLTDEPPADECEEDSV